MQVLLLWLLKLLPLLKRRLVQVWTEVRFLGRDLGLELLSEGDGAVARADSIEVIVQISVLNGASHLRYLRQLCKLRNMFPHLAIVAVLLEPSWLRTEASLVIRRVRIEVFVVACQTVAAFVIVAVIYRNEPPYSLMVVRNKGVFLMAETAVEAAHQS